MGGVRDTHRDHLYIERGRSLFTAISMSLFNSKNPGADTRYQKGGGGGGPGY